MDCERMEAWHNRSSDSLRAALDQLAVISELLAEMIADSESTDVALTAPDDFLPSTKEIEPSSISAKNSLIEAEHIDASDSMNVVLTPMDVIFPSTEQMSEISEQKLMVHAVNPMDVFIDEVIVATESFSSSNYQGKNFTSTESTFQLQNPLKQPFQMLPRNQPSSSWQEFTIDNITSAPARDRWVAGRLDKPPPPPEPPDNVAVTTLPVAPLDPSAYAENDARMVQATLSVIAATHEVGQKDAGDGYRFEPRPTPMGHTQPNSWALKNFRTSLVLKPPLRNYLCVSRFLHFLHDAVGFRDFAADYVTDTSGNRNGDEQGESKVKVLCQLGYGVASEGNESAQMILSCQSCLPKYHMSFLRNCPQISGFLNVQQFGISSQEITPCYHIAAATGIYYACVPYVNVDAVHVTRFLGFASIGNKDKLCFKLISSDSCQLGEKCIFRHDIDAREHYMRGVCFDFLNKIICEKDFLSDDLKTLEAYASYFYHLSKQLSKPLPEAYDQEVVAHYFSTMPHVVALLSQRIPDYACCARIQKLLVVLLLYRGLEATPPILAVQVDESYVPKNNLKETILLLMIHTSKLCLSLCHCGAGQNANAFNLLRKSLHKNARGTNSVDLAKRLSNEVLIIILYCLQTTIENTDNRVCGNVFCYKLVSHYLAIGCSHGICIFGIFQTMGTAKVLPDHEWCGCWGGPAVDALQGIFKEQGEDGNQEAYIGIHVAVDVIHTPNPSQGAILKAQSIKHVKLDDANTGFWVIIFVPNYKLLGIGNSKTTDANWVAWHW